MKISLMPCLCLTGAFLALPAWSQVYRCVDAESEHVTITNVVSKQDKHCTRLETTQDNVMIAPRSSGGGRATTTTRMPGAGAAVVDFPKVSVNEQEAREKDRRVILEQELSSELSKLSQAQRELLELQGKEVDTTPYKERVALHQRNVDALNKEIANLK